MGTREDTSDAQRLRSQRQADAANRRQADEDFQAIAALPAGRRLLSRVLEHCHLFQVSFTGDSKTFFREGERAVGLWLYAEWQRVAPFELADMIQNSVRQAAREDLEARRAAQDDKEKDDAD